MSAADDIVSGIMTKWAENFSKFDADAQASLYSNNALFYGSKPVALSRTGRRRVVFQRPGEVVFHAR